MSDEVNYEAKGEGKGAGLKAIDHAKVNRLAERKVKGEKTRAWTAFLASITALAGAGANYLGADDHAQKVAVEQVTQTAKLDQSYGAMRQALEKMEQANKERDERMNALREAVAELRGGLNAVGSQRVREASQRVAAAIEVVDSHKPAAPPPMLPQAVPEPSKEEVEKRLKAQQKK